MALFFLTASRFFRQFVSAPGSSTDRERVLARTRTELCATAYVSSGGIMVSPDDKMDSPIEDILYWTCKLIDRVRHVCDTGYSDAELESLGEYFVREEELRLAYLVVLRLRWDEVCAHCESIGLTGVTQEMVQDNPFLIAAVYGKFCGFQEWENL